MGSLRLSSLVSRNLKSGVWYRIHPNIMPREYTSAFRVTGLLSFSYGANASTAFITDNW